MELRKCECGAAPIVVCDDEESGYNDWYVCCDGCTLQTTDVGATKSEAIQAWNEGKVE